MRLTRSATRVMAVTVLTAVAGASFGYFHAADAGVTRLQSETKRTFVVHLPRDKQRRMQDLAELSKTDLLGVDHDAGEAEIHVTDAELRNLLARGFDIAFAGRSGAWENNEESGSKAKGIAGYLTPDQIIEFTKRMEQLHPALVRAFEVGKTTRGRPIMAVELSSRRNAPERPVVLFNGMHHARELMTAEIMVDAVEHLVAGYGRDPEITRWLDSYKVVIVPQVNPDGNQMVHGGQRMWRKNAAGDQRGNVFGVDLNRNYPLSWNRCNGSSGSTSSDSYRGPSAGSEPETKAMGNLVAASRPVANISYHTYSELILYPFGCPSDKNPMLDLFKDIAAGVRAGIVDDNGKANTYKVGTPPELLYAADGDDMSWQFRQWHVMSFAIEANSRLRGFQPDYKTWRNVTVARQRGGWKAVLRRMEGASVRGQLHSASGNLDEITYGLWKRGAAQGVRLGAASRWTSFAPSDVNPARVRNPQGLLFLLAMPGQYELRISRAGQVVKSIPVEIGKRTLDLGSISIN